MDSPRGSYIANVKLLLEDVTTELAGEFFDRLAGSDISFKLSDGLLYAAEVVALKAPAIPLEGTEAHDG